MLRERRGSSALAAGPQDWRALHDMLGNVLLAITLPMTGVCSSREDSVRPPRLCGDKAAPLSAQKLPQLCPLTHAAHGKGTSKRATFFSIGCRFHMPLFDKIRRASPLNS
jgi:hypothetical protein